MWWWHKWEQPKPRPNLYRSNTSEPKKTFFNTVSRCQKERKSERKSERKKQDQSSEDSEEESVFFLAEKKTGSS